MQMKKTSLYLAMGAIWALASTAAAAAGIDATWRTTATHAHVPAASVNMSNLVAFDMPLHVQVALKIQNKGALDDFIAAAHNPASPLFHAKLQADDVAANFLPSQAQAQAVADYLSRAASPTSACRPTACWFRRTVPPAMRRRRSVRASSRPPMKTVALRTPTSTTPGCRQRSPIPCCR